MSLDPRTGPLSFALLACLAFLPSCGDDSAVPIYDGDPFDVSTGTSSTPSDDTTTSGQFPTSDLPPDTVLCCIPGACIPASAGACDSLDGEPAPGGDCGSCPGEVPTLPACCLPEGACQELLSAECVTLGGVESAARCDDTDCTRVGEAIVPGLYDVPAGIEELEGLLRVPAQWAMTERGQIPVLMAGTGLVIIDMLTHQPIHQETIGPLFGALAFSAHADMLVTVGPSGRVICEWSDDDDGWLFCGPGGGNFTDATVVGSGPEADAWVDSAFSFGDVFVNRFAADNSLSDSTSVNAAAIAAVSENTVISAYAADRDGPVLMVTNGAPSQLLMHDLVDPDAPATLIADVGNEARRIRCLPPLCVISNLDGNLQRATWSFDAAAPVLVPGGVPVGVGPIGIDLIANGDNIAVVSTAFNDNTVSITEFDPAGAVVSNDEQAVPEGCEGPGHAIWVPDGVGRNIVLTCNATNNYAVIAAP